jgi:hypothetical protein
MLQKFLAAIIAEEWARVYDETAPPGAPLLIKISPLAEELSIAALTWLQEDPPAAYHEMAYSLARIHGECYNLLQSFSTDCKLPFTAIPSLGSEIDITGEKEGCFTIEVGKKAIGSMFDRLKEMLGRTKKRELGIISDKRLKVVSSIDHYLEVKIQNDIRVSAVCAAAFVAFKSAPDKVSPIVKGIMNSIKVCVVTSFRDPNADYGTERGECGFADTVSSRCWILRQILRRPQPHATTGQNRQELVYFLVSGHRTDPHFFLHDHDPGWRPLVPRVQSRYRIGEERKKRADFGSRQRGRNQIAHHTPWIRSRVR